LRILIADDNHMVRRGIVMLLSQENSWSVAGEASNSAEVLQLAEQLRPDVILLDVSMPNIDGLELTRRLAQRLADTKVVIVSQYEPRHLRPLALAAGAVGCIDKSRLANDLLPALRKITAPAGAGFDKEGKGARDFSPEAQ
jgi:DNA-binding NarL/FixJ family response regulator